MGCGVACVASRCGVSYSKALEWFEHPEHAWTRGYYCEEIVATLARAGFEYTFAAFNSREHHLLLNREGTLVFQAPSDEYPHGHYFLRARGGWMNPWSNYPNMIPINSGFQPTIKGIVSFVVYQLPI